MSDEIRLKEDFVLSKCCSPGLDDEIIGYYSYDNILKVHKEDCRNLNKAEQERLVPLVWSDIIAANDFKPDEDYHDLDQIDFKLLSHHKNYGIDYSLKVAHDTNIPKQEAFDRHKKLKEMGLLKRIEALMVQYRKGVVDNKWIKHRNHTYYDLTEKGKRYLEFHSNSGK